MEELGVPFVLSSTVLAYHAGIVDIDLTFIAAYTIWIDFAWNTAYTICIDLACIAAYPIWINLAWKTAYAICIDKALIANTGIIVQSLVTRASANSINRYLATETF